MFSNAAFLTCNTLYQFTMHRNSSAALETEVFVFFPLLILVNAILSSTMKNLWILIGSFLAFPVFFLCAYVTEMVGNFFIGDSAFDNKVFLLCSGICWFLLGVYGFIPLSKTNRYTDGVLLKSEQGERLVCIAEAMYQAVQRRSHSKGPSTLWRGCFGCSAAFWTWIRSFS